MNYPYFDNFTILIYLFAGTLCMLSMKIARGTIRYSNKKSIEGFRLLFITLLFFASLRKVGMHLGGEDALSYQESFINYYNHGSERFESTDILFGLFVGSIRCITDNPIVFRFLCYGLISFGYVYYLKTFCPQGSSCIPYICIMIPYMRSLNTMRNTMSIALFLISLVAFFKNKYYQCIILVVCSVLIHRLTFIMLSFFPFYFIFRNYILTSSKKKLIIFTLVFIFLSYLLAVQLQKFIIIFSLLENNGNADMWYLTTNQGKNILLSWPMYLVHLLLFIALIICYQHVPSTKQINFLKIVFIFDLIMLPATLVLGMWRFAEYFYISNLILWGVLIAIISKMVTHSSKPIVLSIMALGFYGLLYIRLTREWTDAALMPYLFFWQ